MADKLMTTARVSLHFLHFFFVWYAKIRSKCEKNINNIYFTSWLKLTGFNLYNWPHFGTFSVFSFRFLFCFYRIVSPVGGWPSVFFFNWISNSPLNFGFFSFIRISRYRMSFFILFHIHIEENEKKLLTNN